ncbi:MAG: hypothetical protein OXI34_14880 [Chloroflexota bacterium]|nr:hypothetical protein [Chloroflexota bacterium]MDE2948235.1 hypothetical protein [Chloroflexota bacterium]
MQASIAEILDNPAAYAGRIMNVDGILLITDYDRDVARFQQVWLVQQGEPRNRALRAQAISSDSTLWHGLSRLNPRHMPGFQTYRVHDAARACVRVVQAAEGAGEPTAEILTAAVYRQEFTLYVGAGGVRLDQALPARASIRSLPEIQSSIARFLGRRCHVYGTLVIRSAPSAQFLLPGKIPYSDDFRSTVSRLGAGNIETTWLADIEYPQSESAPVEFDRLPESINIDAEYRIREQLAVLPGINQTIVKPAIVAGTLAARDQDEHFATLTDIENVYLQNICYTEAGKSLESVIKLKNFEALAIEI